jgi:hypothetical protein
MTYTFTDHLHNFAVWTAARAVQRNFTNTKNIKDSIDQTGLKGLIDYKENLTIEQFDEFHRVTSNKIIEFLFNLGISASYGQAAKIIAIYIKTSIVIRDSGLSNISKIAHPPIDNILLTRLNKKHPELELSGKKWTKLDKTEYFGLITKLRTLNLDYFWELEKFWIPIQ